MEKQYYWIKLQNDFFDGEQIDYVRDQENGAEYVYIYLRLCFLAANNDGAVERRIGPKVMPYSIAKLAEVVKSTPEHVEAAISLFREIELIEDLENGAFALTRSAEMVGAESSSAKRMRRLRNTKRSNEQERDECDNSTSVTEIVTDSVTSDVTRDVTQASHVTPSVTLDVTPNVTLPVTPNVTLPVTLEYRDKSLELRDREEEKEEISSSSKKRKKKPKADFDVNAAIDALSLSAELTGALKAWAEMRETRKRPVSERGLQIGMGELRKLSGGSEATMIAIVNQSIFRGWDGFFPLKNNSPPGAIAGDPDRREQMKQAVEKGGW